MALSVTAANVKNINCATRTLKAGETITQGQYVYVDESTGKAWLAQCDGAEIEAKVGGMALDSVLAGQDLVIALPGGVIEPGGTLSAGFDYLLSATPGAIEVSGAALPATTTYGTHVLVALSTTRARLICIASGVKAA